jgi:hypothetical protein
MLHKEFNNGLRAYPIHQAVQAMGSTAHFNFLLIPKNSFIYASKALTLSTSFFPAEFFLIIWLNPFKILALDFKPSDQPSPQSGFVDLITRVCSWGNFFALV